MSTDISNISTCAACGKSSENLKTCTACKAVKYCNITCQKSHRKKHKKECKKGAAELFDEDLFKQPPPREDCPICFLRLPIASECYHQHCCGKIVCAGCIHGLMEQTGICAICRAPEVKSTEEIEERLKKRMEGGDGQACFFLGSQYLMREEPNKALEFWLRAVELGLTKPHYGIAFMYSNGKYFNKDPQKASYHLILGAMGGCELSRCKLGCNEFEQGNYDRALKHWMIGVRTGSSYSLDNIREVLQNGHATKAEYEKALRAYQEYHDEVKSDQRDTHAAEFADFL